MASDEILVLEFGPKRIPGVFFCSFYDYYFVLRLICPSNPHIYDDGQFTRVYRIVEIYGIHTQYWIGKPQVYP